MTSDYMEAKQAEGRMKRSRSRYQAVADTIFRLKGLDWTRFEINFEEATENLSVREIRS